MDKISLRTALNIPSINKKDDEVFQNEVIRPIIKLQHLLIIAFFKEYLAATKIDFPAIKKELKLKAIKDSLKKVPAVNAFYKGLISGLFTAEEFKTYLENKLSYNKRIIQIIEQRLIDSIEEICKK